MAAVNSKGEAKLQQPNCSRAIVCWAYTQVPQTCVSAASPPENWASVKLSSQAVHQNLTFPTTMCCYFDDLRYKVKPVLYSTPSFDSRTFCIFGVSVLFIFEIMGPRTLKLVHGADKPTLRSYIHHKCVAFRVIIICILTL